jgi:uncharacterized protein DUF5675
MKTVCILRDKVDTIECLGTLIIIEKGRVLYSSHLLERGWNDNKKNVSCVPEGIFDLKLEYSPKFKMDLWEAKGIPNRSECKFHAASFWDDLNGCFSPGEARFNIGRDKELDMIYSMEMLILFMDAMGKDTEAQLIIKNINF